MILAVGIPLLMKAKVDLKKKIVLVGIFSLGLFVVLAAVLNKYYNFSNPTTTIYMLWYIRESSTAIYVANIPMLWPLFRRFLKAGSFGGSADPSGYNKGSVGSSGTELSRVRKQSNARGRVDTVLDTEIRASPHSSQERINKASSLHDGRIEVETRVSFSVEEQRRLPASFDVEKFGETGYSAHVSGGAS